MCLSLLPDHTHPIATWSREGPGRGEGLLVSEARLSLSYPIGVLPLPPTSLRLQMESHPEEVPILLGPDLLTVRKAGVSRTHSLPNDSYMCRDGSTAEGSLGHRGWGSPKLSQVPRLEVGRLGFRWEIPSLPKLRPALGKWGCRGGQRSLS